MKNLFLKIILGFSFLTANALAADDMKAFPPAETGFTRHVLSLPKEDREDNLKVELQVGRIVEVDERNRYFFGGRIEEETIQGWGYPRYLVKALGPMAGTLMAIDPKAPKRARFIGLGGEPYLIRYNSRLPVVVYVPEGTEVRYRIWRANSIVQSVGRG
jgi:ecotin